MQVPSPRTAGGNTGNGGRVSLRVRGTSEHDGSSRFFVGEIFQGRFRIEALLGEGGMGRVFAAHDLNLDRPVAIKMLHAGFDDEESIARFLREGKVLARLSSEHTVRAYELAHDPNGAPYIVMERVSGRAIDALIAERGPPPCEEAIEYVRQVCLALAEAHAFGIVHRDIKPGNILVDEGAIGGPRVMVVDFGVAKARPHRDDRSGLTSISALLGTPEYMAPEQLYAAREVDHRADIWALGATLYFMLVGKPPVEAPNLGELVDRIQHGPTPSARAHRPDVPAHVEQVIARCLHRDPVGRFRSVQEMASATGSRLQRQAADAPRRHRLRGDRDHGPVALGTVDRRRADAGGHAAVPVGVERPDRTAAAEPATSAVDRPSTAAARVAVDLARALDRIGARRCLGSRARTLTRLHVGKCMT
jgi:serine/threonine protein kinase